MINLSMKNLTQCQNDLKLNGFCKHQFDLPGHVLDAVKNCEWEFIDQYFSESLNSGELKNILSQFFAYKNAEHILAIRDSQNPDEEDGIWHDDGSRDLAFSLSLTIENVIGGELGIRKKNTQEHTLIPTQKFGTLLIFATGKMGFEHKTHKVLQGKRVVLAGWLT
jgi:hypothetical protein